MELTQHLAGSVVDSGLDWLSFTVQHGNEALERLKSAWEQQITAEVYEYGESKETAPQGYTGIKSRHWFYGQRADGWLFQASSGAAKEAGEIVRECRASVQATRTDFQATVQRPFGVRGSFAAIRSSIRDREQREGRNSRSSVALFESDSSGDSVVLNSRGAKRTLTIYDKSAEQRGKVAPNLIRFELRCRGQQARANFAQFLKHPEPSTLSRELVADMMKRNSLPAPWSEPADGLRLASSYEQTTDERRLNWLLTTVAPVMRKIECAETRKRLRREFGLDCL